MGHSNPQTTKIKANRLFQAVRHGARVAGQSANPIANVGGDIVGVVMDGAAFLQDPKNPENVADLALSGGQMAANLAAAGGVDGSASPMWVGVLGFIGGILMYIGIKTQEKD